MFTCNTVTRTVGNTNEEDSLSLKVRDKNGEVKQRKSPKISFKADAEFLYEVDKLVQISGWSRSKVIDWCVLNGLLVWNNSVDEVQES